MCTCTVPLPSTGRNMPDLLMKECNSIQWVLWVDQKLRALTMVKPARLRITVGLTHNSLNTISHHSEKEQDWIKTVLCLSSWTPKSQEMPKVELYMFTYLCNLVYMHLTTYYHCHPEYSRDRRKGGLASSLGTLSYPKWTGDGLLIAIYTYPYYTKGQLLFHPLGI